jgi:hypothetical protein
MAVLLVVEDDIFDGLQGCELPVVQTKVYSVNQMDDAIRTK